MILKGSSVFKDTILRKVIIDCICGTHSIQITSMDDEDDIYLSFWTDNFYGKQQSHFFRKLFHKIKIIWSVILGKEYRIEDIVLEKKDVNDLIEGLNEIQKNKMEEKNGK